MITIDLNCDMGESFGPYTLGADEEVMASISSANVACGYHGGDPAVMRRTVRLAREAGVAVGAHPGLPDLAGFGRREMRVSAQEVEDLVLYQLGALAAIAHSQGVRLNHVKPHGALYTMAARDRALADAIARAVAGFDPSLILFGLPRSELIRAGAAAGLRVASEGFADRAYEADGSLASRARAGAVIHDTEAVVRRAVRMAVEGRIATNNGSDLDVARRDDLHARRYAGRAGVDAGNPRRAGTRRRRHRCADGAVALIRLLAWWHDGTVDGRRAIIAAGLGWMLDAFDVTLFALVLPAIRRDLGLSTAAGGALGSVALLAAAVGGVGFGVVRRSVRPHACA